MEIRFESHAYHSVGISAAQLGIEIDRHSWPPSLPISPLFNALSTCKFARCADVYARCMFHIRKSPVYAKIWRDLRRRAAFSIITITIRLRVFHFMSNKLTHSWLSQDG